MATWVIAVAAFAVASMYAVGGRDLFRQLVRRGREVRSQATAALQPPTQAEMQRAARNAVGATTSQTDATLPPPASLGVIAVWIGSILIVVVAMFFVTGQSPRKRPGD